MRPNIPKIFKKIITPVILLLTLSFILRTVFLYWGQIESNLFFLSWQSIFISVFCYLVYFYLRAFSWHFILKSIGCKSNPVNTLSIWILGEATRYIPGNVWSFISRLFLARKKGFPKSLITASFFIEITLLLIITSILSIPALANSLEIIENIKSLFYISGFILLMGLIISIKFLMRKIRKLLIKLDFSTKDLLIAVTLQLFAWIFFGFGSLMLFPKLEFANISLAFSVILLSWLIGFLSYLSPMGLGVREGALIIFLSPLVGVVQATFIAIISRIILVGTEILNISFWILKDHRNKFLDFWKKFIKHWDLIFLTIFIISYSLIFSNLSILRHESFASNFDLANMDQTIWNTLHGKIFMMTTNDGNVSRLSTHADFILILLAPLYLIWDNVKMILITQSILLALGAIPVYFLSKKLLKNELLSLVLVLIYMLNPAMQWANIYDFHGVTLAIPFLITTFFFAYLKKWKWYLVFFILSLITKEEISLFLAIMGIGIALIFKAWKVGLISFLVGMIWFPVMVFLVIPHFNLNGQHWAFNDWYSLPKNDLNQHNLLSLFNLVKSNAIYPSAINYYSILLKPFAFLPILGLPWILMALPEILINISSSYAGMETINLHYASGIIPALIIATIFAIRYLQLGINKWLQGYLSRFKYPLLLLIICGFLISSIRYDYYSGPLPVTPFCWCYVYQVGKEDIEFEEVLNTIPAESVISASGEVRPHLTHRENAFSLPDIPENTNYIAMIDQQRLVGNYNPHSIELGLINDFSKIDSRYVLVNKIGHFYLYKKRDNLSDNL